MLKLNRKVQLHHDFQVKLGGLNVLPRDEYFPAPTPPWSQAQMWLGWFGQPAYQVDACTLQLANSHLELSQGLSSTGPPAYTLAQGIYVDSNTTTLWARLGWEKWMAQEDPVQRSGAKEPWVQYTSHCINLVLLDVQYSRFLSLQKTYTCVPVTAYSSNWTQDLKHAKHMFHHWAMAPPRSHPQNKREISLGQDSVHVRKPFSATLQ